jgi:hypothetical protein
MTTDDANAIRNLLSTYCELQDSGDVAAVSELFRHSTYDVAGGATHFGYDEVLALKSKSNRTYEDGTLRTKHVTTNSIIEIAPDGMHASARSYFSVYQATDGFPLQAIIAGRYHDRFEKVDGAWRFCRRTIHSDLVGNLSGHQTTTPSFVQNG